LTTHLFGQVTRRTCLIARSQLLKVGVHQIHKIQTNTPAQPRVQDSTKTLDSLFQTTNLKQAKPYKIAQNTVYFKQQNPKLATPVASCQFCWSLMLKTNTQNKNVYHVSKHFR
jgi:hypothetical protein